MLSGFSSYLFGGNAGEESRVMAQEDSVTSADTSDWVFVESHLGKMPFFVSFFRMWSNFNQLKGMVGWRVGF